MKRAYLVVGAESTGTRLMTQILISMGCAGDSGHNQRWEGGKLPEEEEAVVLRRSVPHRKQWPDLAGMVNRLRGRGYRTQAIVTVRDPFATAASQIKAGHTRSQTEAMANISQAYGHIYQQLVHVRCPVLPVPYEALVNEPDLQRRLARFLLLDDVEPVDVYNGNAKWYADEA